MSLQANIKNYLKSMNLFSVFLKTLSVKLFGMEQARAAFNALNLIRTNLESALNSQPSL